MSTFASHGGSARWVTSPILIQSDWDALQLGHQAKTDEVLHAALLRNVQDLEKSLQADTLSALAWMVSDGILEFRLALPRNKLQNGEFHDKFGVFRDEEGNRIAFNGSYNDSQQGLLNYESIKVFTSWNEAFKPLVEADERRFEELWENRDPNVEVYDLPSAAKAAILKLRDAQRPYKLPAWLEKNPVGDGAFRVRFSPPPGLEPREYQKEAMRAWLANNGRGIFAMATGTGKTATALYLAYKLVEQKSPCLLIVTCPYLNLARQWEENLSAFGLPPVPCYGTWSSWYSRVQGVLTALSVGAIPVAALIVTNATFLTERFQKLIAAGGVKRFLIADEVHNLGAARLRTVLDDRIEYRLGLSATPRRHHDEDGSAALLQYFGPIVFEYGIDEAIKAGVLCRYTYHPVLVDLTDDEGATYWDLTMQIARRMGSEKDGELSDGLKFLLLQRARLLGAARNKLPALRELVASLDQPVERAIVYCGDGRVEAEEAGDEELQRQVDAATRLLGTECRLRVRKFTCDESMAEREEILRQLRDGRLHATVAIRCLDEGIDVPDVRMAFILASSTNPRQFVQRRGRLLRRAEGKTRARIWDFIIRPPDMGSRYDDATFNVERRLFQRDLVRVVEFCQTAENGDAALQTLRDLRRRYHLLDI
ncbi:MAG: DEAD/DEAH box helicase family protein [Kiritimatiellia bacterium]